jgi:hypothetical protein
MAGNRRPSSKADGRRQTEPGSFVEDHEAGQSITEKTGLMSRIAYVTGRYWTAFVNRVQRLFSRPECDCETARLLLWDEILRDFEARFRYEALLQRESKDGRLLDKSTLDLDRDAASTVKGMRPPAETGVPELSRPNSLSEPTGAPQAEPLAGGIADSDAWPTGGQGPAETQPWFLWVSGVPDTTTGISCHAEEDSRVAGEALAASLHALETLADPDQLGAMGPAVHVGTDPGTARPPGEHPVRTPFALSRRGIEWLSASPCQVVYSAVPADSKESGNQQGTSGRDAGPFAFITSLRDVRHDAREGPAAKREDPTVDDLGRVLAAILGGSEYDRIIGHAIVTLIERGDPQAFRRLARLCESHVIQTGTLGRPPDLDDGFIGKRKHTNTYRRMWERRHGREWPDDPTRPGSKMVVHHNDPLGDGGPDVAENVQPMTYESHIHHYREDFRRWGARGRLNRKGEQELHGRELNRQS